MKIINQKPGGIVFLFFAILFGLMMAPLNTWAEKSISNAKNATLPAVDSSEVYRLIDTGIQQLETGKKSGMRTIEKAIELANKNNLDEQTTRYLNQQSIHLRYQGRYALAIKLGQKSLELASQIRDTLLMSRSYNQIGVCYRRLDSYQRAIENHQKALSLAEKINDSLGMAMAINSLGNVSLLLGNLDESMKYFSRSLKLEQNRNNLIGVAINFNNIGHVYQEKGLFLKALHYYQLSLNIDRGLQSKRGIAICNNDIADLYMKMGKYQKALRYALEAIQLTKAINNHENLAYAYLKTGESYIGLKNIPFALRYLDSCVNLSKQLRMRAILEESYHQLFNIYYNKKQYKKAITYLQLQNLYQDSLMNIELQKNTTRLQIEFETERYKNNMISFEQQAQLANEKAKAALLLAKKKQYLLYFLISALILAVMILAFGGFYLATRNRQTKLLEKKNKDIEKARQAIEANARELSLAKQKAEESDRAKSRFMASISHEIRTPLNAVLGYADILQSMVNDPQERQYLEAIQSSGKSLLNLMNDILDLSKLETGKFSIHKTEMSLYALLEDVKNIFSLKAKEKNIDLQLDISPDFPQTIIFDEIRLRQILLNIVGNAIKFTHKGTVKIIAHAEREPAENRIKLIIQVKDTGIGIPLEEQDLIFKPFEQGTEQQNEEGSGLGLSISKRLVEAMDGKILLNSQPGQGSIFTLQFDHIEYKSIIQTKPKDTKPNSEKNVLLFIHQQNNDAHSIAQHLKELNYFILDVGVKVNEIRKHLINHHYIILCCVEPVVLKNTLRAIKNNLTAAHLILFIGEKEIDLDTGVTPLFFVKHHSPLSHIYPSIETWLTKVNCEAKANNLFVRRDELDNTNTAKYLEDLYQNIYLKAKNTRLLNNIEKLARALQKIAISQQMDELKSFTDEMLNNINNFELHLLDQQLEILEKAFQTIRKPLE